MTQRLPVPTTDAGAFDADWLDDFLAGELEDVAYTVDRL